MVNKKIWVPSQIIRCLQDFHDCICQKHREHLRIVLYQIIMLIFDTDLILVLMLNWYICLTGNYNTPINRDRLQFLKMVSKLIIDHIIVWLWMWRRHFTEDFRQTMFTRNDRLRNNLRRYLYKEQETFYRISMNNVVLCFFSGVGIAARGCWECVE